MRRLKIPLRIRLELKKGAVVAISISGGKDSQALLKAVTQAIRRLGYGNRILAIHADLGRVEWRQTHDFCHKICHDLDVPLFVVRRQKGDLLARWQERMAQLEGTGKPFWSSAKARYCTSDMKIQPINKFLRQFDRVISVEGIRAEESKSRASKPCTMVRKAITTRTRNATTWNAIHDWTIEDVYGSYGNTLMDLKFARDYFNYTGLIHPDWQFHPAYAMGNERLSCALCVLGSVNDIKNGIRHNPELADTLIDMEIQSGFTFKQGKSLQQYRDELTLPNTNSYS
jgi:hypothetical protein